MTRDGPIKMADIARLAKVSMSTVSRALAENPLIPRDKRLEIQKIAQDAGYVINQSARSLRLRRTETIAVVFPLGHDVGQLISDPFFIDMFGRLADEITARGYQVLLCRVTETTEGWLERIIHSQRQDGVVLIGQSDQNDAINKSASIYSQMVVWGSTNLGQTYCSVGSDNIVGARTAVEHLLGLGRRRIAFMGMPELPEIGMRQQGYFQALEASGLEIDPQLSVRTHFSSGTAYEDALKFVTSGTKFDAIFAASDVIAIAAMKALAACNISVPHDVSVVGFDDIARAADSNPPLTTIRQDLGLAARAIVELLFQRIAGQKTTSVTLIPQLIVRNSSRIDQTTFAGFTR